MYPFSGRSQVSAVNHELGLVGLSPEVPFRKGVAGAGLEVAFERIGLGIVFESYNHHWIPWPKT